MSDLRGSVKRPASLREGKALKAKKLNPAALSPRGLLAVGMSAIAVASPVFAQDDEIELGALQIEERTIDTNPYAEEGAPYKAKISGDARHVKPLAETPQTISVLTQTQIQESGRSDLREILAGQPGITLGTGENGNAFGDRYVIRGHEARSDVFVDGLRDPGMTTRESFAVEQIEITKGPSSTFAGRGSTGGAINSVTKQASTEYDFTKLQTGLGTDSYYRLALDSNQKINDDLAVRANVLFAGEDVPDREPAARERSGIALSGSFTATEKLTLTADYYFFEAEDKPDLGTYIDRSTRKPVADVPVYLQNQDFLNSEINTATLRAQYEFTDSVNISNALRYGTTENGYVVSGLSSTTRDVSDPVAPGATSLTVSTHQGWQDVEYLVNQTNLYVDIGAHELLFGFEYSDMAVENGVYAVTNNGSTNCVLPPSRRAPGVLRQGHCLTDGDGNEVDNINGLLGREITKGNFDSDYQVITTSLSVMDTISLAEQWSLFLGVRLDNFDYENDVVGHGSSEPTHWEYSDTLWNGHAGLVYDVTDEGNIYLTYSTAANINGGESDVGGNCGYGGLCGSVDLVEQSKPESVENIELGTKWNILDEKLLVTAAIFQITKSDVMEGADYESTGTLNTGKNRVQGVEFSVVGNLTDKLSTQFGVAFMDAEVLESFNNGINEGTDDVRGRTLTNFADDSAFLQMRYQATDKFSMGAAYTYTGEMYSGQPDTAAGWSSAANDYSIPIPDYGYMDLFATYEFSEQVNMRLNVGNVTDKDYYVAAYRSGSFTYMGDARQTTLTIEFEI